MSKNAKEELSKGLASTMGLLNLSPSELKKAQSVVPGENRSDLVVGKEPAAAPSTPPPIEPSASPARRATAPEAPRLPAATKPRPAKARTAKLMRVEVPLRVDQLEFLNEIEFNLRVRKFRGGRLTRASVVRGLIDLLPDLNLDYNAISSEDSLRDQIRAALEANLRSQTGTRAS